MKLRARVREIGRWSSHAAMMMIGVPSYDTYLAHMAEHHPGQKAMSYAEFFRNRQDARYGVGCKEGTRGFRCC